MEFIRYKYKLYIKKCEVSTETQISYVYNKIISITINWYIVKGSFNKGIKEIV